jgi:signal transduction histidine kinase
MPRAPTDGAGRGLPVLRVSTDESHGAARRTLAPSAIAVLVGGVALSSIIAALSEMPFDDAVTLLSLTALASVACAGAGYWVLHLRGPRSLRTQVVVVSATATAVVIAGLVAAAKAMFISTHDRNVLFVVVSLATSASVAVALQLASVFVTDAAAVDRLTRDIGDGRRRPPRPTGLHIKEMDQLADRLAAADARLEGARQRERAIETSRRELVSWISHDLRSPLASIRALAEALEDHVVTDPADVERYHRSIRIESERLSTLVDDLFELSRLHAGTARDSSGTIPVHELIADAIAGVDAAAEVKGVRIDVDVDLVASIDVPAADVLRIVRNLLDNAVRHTPPGGRVCIEGLAEAGGVLLSVSDECGGIPEPDIPRLFDVAFRGDAARGRDGSTGGLGLTIAKGLAEAHAGTIDVRNHDGGCRFRVRIPAASGQGQPRRS